MASSETELCNLALLRIGHRALLTAYSTDTSAEAVALRVLYPHARDTTLAAYPWRFARSSSELALDVDALFTGWEYVYVLPRDFLLARSIYPGVNEPAEEQLVPHDVMGAYEVEKTAAVAGMVRAGTTVTVTTETDHNLIVGDTFVLSPGEADFAAGTKTVVTAADETTLTYTEAGAAVASTLEQTLTFEHQRILGTDLVDAELVYTRTITDVSEMPLHFQDAVAWALAMELALGVANKPALLPMLDAKFRSALGRAAALDKGQAQRGTAPYSEFERVRG